MIHSQPYVAMAARAINPVNWVKTWKHMEGMQFKDLLRNFKSFGDRQIDKVVYIHSRGQHRAMWWANPLGYSVIILGTYKAYQMIWITRKQKKAAQLVAAAYGQGGQWLNPVPK
eukprot:GHVU01177536.1.p1 GENE.GHVU01177536.1~~GHVU01177536.1.p1  ORF type:complete len:114 (+),score=13.17 GHVU01177536.1:213-554(+)